MDKKIIEIYKNALGDLEDRLVDKITKEDLFIVKMIDDEKNELGTFVDFEHKMIWDDYDKYVSYAEKLYTSFIKKESYFNLVNKPGKLWDIDYD